MAPGRLKFCYSKQKEVVSAFFWQRLSSRNSPRQVFIDSLTSHKNQFKKIHSILVFVNYGQGNKNARITATKILSDETAKPLSPDKLTKTDRYCAIAFSNPTS